MKKVLRLAAALAVLGAGIWAWGVLFPSPEKVIIGQFHKLAEAASVHAGEGYIPRLAGAQSVGRYFSANVQLNISLPGHNQQTVISRDDIVQGLMAAHLNGGLTLKLQDIRVTVSADQQTAQAEMTVEARIPGDDLIVQEMNFTLQRIDGKWLITGVQTVRTFSSLISIRGGRACG